MRKFAALLIGFAFVTGALVAQTHDNMTEKTGKETVTLASDLKVGSVLLKAGEYRVFCDTKTVTFASTADGKPVLEVPCKGALMSAKSDVTTMSTSLDKTGVRVLDKLTIRGSNVEHVFK
jgi:hypothetical protein